MSLSSEDVEKIAHLARLALPPAQTAALGRELSRILDLVAQMDAVAVEGVQPMAHPLEMSQRLRPDVATESNHREDYQSIAPETAAGLYLVPRVID
jgi:aspartyl-tRNA(Asn)/glutamyl-tRNA(Gln) amidotransferase subunit C